MHISRNFRLFFVGQLISVTGTWVNWTAGAVLVLKLTDSGVALGIEAALLFLPVLHLRGLRRLARRPVRQAPHPRLVERRLRRAGRGAVRARRDGRRRDLDGVRDRVPDGVDPRDRAADPAVVLRRAGRGGAHHERDQPEQRRLHRDPGAGRRDRRDDDPHLRPVVPVPPGRGVLRRRPRCPDGDADRRAPRATEGRARAGPRPGGPPLRLELPRAPRPADRDAPRVPLHLQLQRGDPAARLPDV